MADENQPPDSDMPQDPLPDYGMDDVGGENSTGNQGSGQSPTEGEQYRLGPKSGGESNPAQPGQDPLGFAGGTPSSGSNDPNNPFAALFATLGGQGGSPDMNSVMQQLQSMFSTFGGPQQMFNPGAGDGGVNWDMTKDTARKTTASLGQDPAPTQDQRRAVTEAISLAETWLDEATRFTRAGRTSAAWSRADWVENTMPAWQQLIEPIATHIADAMEGALSLGDDQGVPPQMKGMEQMLRPMLRSSGASMFGMQAGQALGRLATEVVGTTDIALPLTQAGQLALLPFNVEKFAEGLEQTTADVMLYLALREAARHRLFAAAGWLRDQLVALIAEYAHGISIDTSALERAAGDLQGGNLDDIGQALEGGLFEPQKTPQQQATLERLETRLALIEGWVDDVVSQATARWMPAAEAIAEMVRRQRASGGPAEATFASLVGLELRPRRLRDAANLWAAVRNERGAQGRDAIWSHPDLLPTAADLDDPIGYAKGENGKAEDQAFDAALAQLLDNPESNTPGGADTPGDSAEGGSATDPDDSAEGTDDNGENLDS
jgi:putative hydrolase